MNIGSAGLASIYASLGSCNETLLAVGVAGVFVPSIPRHSHLTRTIGSSVALGFVSPCGRVLSAFQSCFGHTVCSISPTLSTPHSPTNICQICQADTAAYIFSPVPSPHRRHSAGEPHSMVGSPAACLHRVTLQRHRYFV